MPQSTSTLLNNFVEEYNSDALNITPYGDSDTIQPVYHPKQPTYGMRPSSVGQPAIISVYSVFMARLGGNKLQSVMLGVPISYPYGRKQDLFNVGHSTEARLLMLLTDYGFDVAAHVPNNAGTLLGGTCDCILDGTLLVDVKTAAAANFKRYSSELPDKYVAQLAVYAEGLKAEWGDLASLVLMYNKDNSELQVIVPKRVDLEKALARAKVIEEIAQEVCDMLDDGNSIQECVEYISDNVEYMALRPEVYDKEETGNLLVPTDLQYNPWLLSLLYETYDGINQRKKPTRYVTRELETEEIVNKIKELQATWT